MSPEVEFVHYVSWFEVIECPYVAESEDYD